MPAENRPPAIFLSKWKATMLLQCGIPLIVIHAMDYLVQLNQTRAADDPLFWRQDIMLLEMFSGSAKLTEAFRDAGQRATGFDSVHHVEQDLTTVQGFLMALRDTMRLSEKGLLWGGIPCGSFVFMNLSRTCRNHDVLGNEDNPAVAIGNMLCARFAILALVATCLNRHWVVEQPMSSVLYKTPYMKFLLALRGVTAFFHRFWMANYGHFAPKPSQLFGTGPWLTEFNDQLSKKTKNDLKLDSSHMVRRAVDKDGKKQVTGGPALKTSAAYTPEFAQAVCKKHLDFVASDDFCGPQHAADEEIPSIYDFVEPPLGWHHAHLQEVKAFLQQEAELGRYKPSQLAWE